MEGMRMTKNPERNIYQVTTRTRESFRNSMNASLPYQKVHSPSFHIPQGRGIVVLCFLLITCTSSLFSAAQLIDPDIPDGETAVYRIEEDDRTYLFTERVSVLHEEGDDIYRILHEEESQTIEVKILKDSLIPFSVYTSITGETLTEEYSTKVTLHQPPATTDIAVLSFADLRYVLRGYPFSEDTQDLGIVVLGGEDDIPEGIEIRLSYKGIEELELENNKTIECHELELKMKASGIMSVITSFMGVGKTHFWYSVEYPHYLVAYEGLSGNGSPGSSESNIELVQYSGWKQ